MSTLPTGTPPEILTVLEQSPTDLAFTCDADRHITWASPSFMTVLGLETPDLIGRDPVTLLHPDDVRAAQERSARLRAGEARNGRESDWRVRLLDVDGRPHWMLGTIVRLDDDRGALHGFAIALHHIDDLIRLSDQAAAGAERTRAIIESLLDPIILMQGVRDESGVLIDLLYVDCNDAAWQYNQLTREQMIDHRLLDLFPGQATEGPLPLYFEVLETGEPCILDDYAYPHEIIGSERRYDIRAMRAGDDLLALTWRDVTDRYRDRQALAVSEQMYRLATEDVTDAVLQSDEDMTITWVSPSFEELAGYADEEVLGRNGLDFVIDPDVEQIRAAMRRARTTGNVSELHLRLRRKDGTPRWVSSRLRFATQGAGGAFGYVSVVRDIDDEIRVRQQLEHQTRHDMLTGLANRQLFEERVTAHLHGHGDSPAAVLTVGIDRLTPINDALSYGVGDLVIRTVAARIGNCVADRAQMARIGGDTFGVLVSAPHSGQQVAESILTAVRQPLVVDEHSILPTVSIGLAMVHPDDDAAELLRRSAVGMRHAEEQGRDRWAEAGLAAASAAVHEWEFRETLQHAITNHVITGWYQPVVSLTDREVKGYELLARWPDGGHVDHTPGVFIPSAEEAGLIETLDRRMIERAVEALPDLDGRHLAVNISMATLSSPSSFAWMRSLADRHHGALEGLYLEVTETTVRSVTPALIAGMESLCTLGVRWLVDDFGTGYSSISHLRDLPVHGLKLDISFTRGIAAGDDRSLVLARGLAGLAHGLGLETIAEGVEDEQTAATLAEAGWELAQGYLFGQATPEPLP